MCGGGTVGEILHPIVDVGAAFLGNTVGGPLGAAALETAVQKAQGEPWKQALVGGATAGVTSGIGDVITGAPLTGSGLTGLENTASSVSNALGFGGGAPASGSTATSATTSPGVGSSGTPSPAISSSAPAASSAPGGAGAIAAPSGVDTSGGLPWQTNAGNVGSLSTQSLGTPASSFGGEQLGTPTAANTGTSLGNVAGNINIAPAGGATINPGTAGGGYDLAGNFSGGAGSAVTGGGAAVPETGGFMNTVKGLLGKNASPLGLGVAGLGLAGDIIKGNQSIKGERQIQAEAGQLANQGAKLGNYLETGTLPPGLQTALNQAADAMKARIQSKYASMGLEGSSAMQQELANVDMQTQGAAAQEALNLLNQGVNETGMASQLYQFMINNTLTQDQQLGQAISGFAQAAAGGNPVGAGRTITVS